MVFMSQARLRHKALGEMALQVVCRERLQEYGKFRALKQRCGGRCSSFSAISQPLKVHAQLVPVTLRVGDSFLKETSTLRQTPKDS